jgi:hypothetical protein
VQSVICALFPKTRLYLPPRPLTLTTVEPQFFKMVEDKDYNLLFDANNHDDNNALRVFAIQTRAFPSLSMEHRRNHSNFLGKDVPFQNLPISGAHYDSSGTANSKRPAPDPSMATSGPREDPQPTPTPGEGPKAGKKQSLPDSLVGLPTPTTIPAESSLTSPSTTPEPVIKPITFIPNAYFRCPIQGFNNRFVDINNMGILYEYKDAYFVVVEVPHPDGGKNALCRGFIKHEHVGPYLRFEWAALTTNPTGNHDSFGAGVNEARFTVQSGMLKQMRSGCVNVARIAENQAQEYENQRGQVVDDATYKGLLNTTMVRMVDNIYGPTQKREAKEMEEANPFMEEFMVFED